MVEVVQVTTSTGSRDEADRIATALVESRLAACVQVVGPVTSRYWWAGEVQTSEEWLCLAKVTAHRYPEVEAAIRHRHPYDEPEIVAVPVVAGSPSYLDWVAREAGGR